MTTIERPHTGISAASGSAIVPNATRFAGAATTGLLAGVATSYLQADLPPAWSQVANSGAVWTVAAFVIAVLCAGPRWVATAAGGLALVGEVAGYYLIASPLRGIPTTLGEEILWTVAALWIGPLAGYAAWCWRRGDASARVVAALSLSGLVAGEGWYEAARLGYGLFGRTEILLAAAFALPSLVLSRAGWGARLVAVGAAALVAVSTAAVYLQTVLM